MSDPVGVGKRIVWSFSTMLGYSPLGRFVVHQDPQNVLRCQIAALREKSAGVPFLYDRPGKRRLTS
jgi:hypothetical protein